MFAAIIAPENDGYLEIIRRIDSSAAFAGDNPRLIFSTVLKLKIKSYI